MKKHFAVTNNSKDQNLHAEGENPLFGTVGIMMDLVSDEMSGTDCTMLYSIPRDHDYAICCDEGDENHIPTDTLENFTRKISDDYCSDNCDFPVLYELVKLHHKEGHTLIVIDEFRCNLLAHSEEDADLLFKTCTGDWQADVKHFEERKMDFLGKPATEAQLKWWYDEGRPWRAEKLARAAANYYAVKFNK